MKTRQKKPIVRGQQWERFMRAANRMIKAALDVPRVSEVQAGIKLDGKWEKAGHGKVGGIPARRGKAEYRRPRLKRRRPTSSPNSASAVATNKKTPPYDRQVTRS